MTAKENGRTVKNTNALNVQIEDRLKKLKELAASDGDIVARLDAQDMLKSIESGLFPITAVLASDDDVRSAYKEYCKAKIYLAGCDGRDSSNDAYAVRCAELLDTLDVFVRNNKGKKISGDAIDELRAFPATAFSRALTDWGVVQDHSLASFLVLVDDYNNNVSALEDVDRAEEEIQTLDQSSALVRLYGDGEHFVHLRRIYRDEVEELRIAVLSALNENNALSLRSYVCKAADSYSFYSEGVEKMKQARTSLAALGNPPESPPAV